MTEPLLKWEKASYKRYYTRLGPLTIEVIRSGIEPNRCWRVGEVFGQHHHDRRVDEAHDGMLIGAQLAAEKHAATLLQQATAFLHVRDCAGGPPRHGKPKRCPR